MHVLSLKAIRIKSLTRVCPWRGHLFGKSLGDIEAALIPIFYDLFEWSSVIKNHTPLVINLKEMYIP